MVVYETGGYDDVAEQVAADRGEAVVGELDAALASDERILYVAEPTSMDEQTMLRLQRRLLRRGPETGGFGVLTGYTPTAAAELYAPSETTDDGHCLVLGKLYEDWHTYDEETEVLLGEDVSTTALAAQNDRGLDSLAIFEDGWSIHLYLNDGYVCGIPETRATDDFDGPHPTCAIEGGGECPLAGERIRADQLDASHVFVNSCAPMLVNGVVGLPVHTGMSLLDGADSLIGSYRLVHSLHEEVLLHYALLRGGYDLAERCYLLNRNAHALGVKSFPYVGFGRPAATSHTARQSSADVTTAPRDDGVELHVSEFAGHVLDTTVDLPSADRYYVRNLTDRFADAPLYYTAFEEDNRVRVLVYTWGYVEIDDLRLAVSTRPAGADDRLIAADAADGFRALDRLNLLDGKAAGQVTDLENKLGGLADDAYTERMEANGYREAADRADQLASAVDNVHDRLTSLLQTRSESFLFGSYKSRTVPAGAYPSDRSCRNCGTQVFVREMADVTDSFARALGTCPRCGYVFDVPATDGEELPVPTVEPDLMNAAETTQEMCVQFTNPKSVPMQTTVYPWIKSERDDYHGIRLFDPDQRRRRLDPGETVRCEFELDLTQLDESENPKENKYHVFGFVIGNGNIYSGSSRLFVGGPERYPFTYE